MSSHIFSDEQLIAFALGELDDAEAERVASHLAECAQCRGTLASFQGIRAFLRQDDSVPVPPATMARAEAIFRKHASISQPGWFEYIRRGPLQRARQLAGVSAFASLLLTLVLLYSSARLAAPAVQATLPGDPLYPVKTTMEDVRVAVALDDSTRVRAQLSIAQARVTEISALVEQGRYDFLPKTTQDYQEHVQQATATLGEVLRQNPEQVALAQKAEQDLARYEVSLAVLQENSPGDVKPQIRQAVIASTAAKSKVQNQLSNISSPSSGTPAPLMTPTPSVVVTATSAPAFPAPTIVITQPGVVITPSPSVGSPTTASASPSSSPSVSPVASRPASTTTVVSATSTVVSTSTPVAPTGTRPATITSAPTSTPAPTDTVPATTTATTTPGTHTPTPTPGPSTSPVPASVSQTTTPALSSPTPAVSVTSTTPIEPTSTPPALPTSTSSVPISASPSLTSTPVPDATSIPPGPSATTTPFAVTPSASNPATPSTPTPVLSGGTSSPSAGSGSAGGTKSVPPTPNPSAASTAPAATPATGGGASATALSPAQTPGTSSAPTTTPRSPGTNSAPTAPTGTVGSPVGPTPAGTLPTKEATPTTGLEGDLVDFTDMRAFYSAIGTDCRMTDDDQMMCDVPQQSKSSLPPIIFGVLALLASLGIIIPTR